MHRRAFPVHLSPRFTHLVEAHGTLVLVGDDDSVLLDVPEATAVLGLVDGERSARAIAELLESRHEQAVTYFVLLALERQGIVREGPRERDDPGEEDGGAGESAAVAELAEAMRRAWLGRKEAPWVRVATGQTIDVVLTDDYLEPRLAEAAPGGRGPRAILVRLGGLRTFVGPVLGAGGPCVACLQERMHLNLAARALVHAEQSEDGIAVRRLSTRVPGWAFREAARRLVEWRDGVEGGAALLAVERDGAYTRHAVHRLPHCGACGDPGLVEPGAAIHLASRPRAPGSSGGYRTVTPAQTLERYAGLVSPLTGVVRQIREVPVEGTDLVHVYSASHALRGGQASIKGVRADRREHSGGKGRTDLDARVSALCESLERYSSIHRGSEPTVMARRSDLGDEAVHPADLLLFSAAQVEERTEWNARQAGSFQVVPEPYRDEPIEWSKVRSLATDEVRWIPSSFVFFSFRGEGMRFCRADSNGLAGGNCLEEAVLQGLLELVERDAVALWWYNRSRRPGLDLASAQDPWVDGLLAYYASLGRDLWVLDLTSDLAIPCFAAVSARNDKAPEEPIFGFGAHLDPAIALSRALTEVNQMLPTVLRSDDERRRQLLPDFRDAIDWWASARLDEHPYLVPDHEVAGRPLTRYRAPETADLLEDVEHCVARVAAAGCDVLVYDLTRPDVRFAVAKVVAPGLRHMWRRLAPGRLYEVPVRLGWSEAPIPEEELNPVSLFV